MKHIEWLSAAAFESGTLKVGEVIIPGKSDQSFMLVAHLCHPAMVNDDLTGVVVGLDVARALLEWSPTLLHLPAADFARDHRVGRLPQPSRTLDPQNGWRTVPGNARQ